MCNNYLIFIAIYSTLILSTSCVPKETKHYEQGVHNPNYDAQAILGEENLTGVSEEKKRMRLGDIVDEMDTDKNGLISQDELKKYIQHMQLKYVTSDTERHWKHLKLNDYINFTFYAEKTYGLPDDPEFKDRIERDQLKWNAADVDRDGQLSKQEFMVFLHPEDHEHMKYIVMNETFQDIDKNGDGKITLEEYIGDLYHIDPTTTNGEDEPEWVKQERIQFREYRDKDKDGFLNMDELKEWYMPDDYDHAEAEAIHLITEADTDKDGMLTKNEILDKMDLFTGSQVTDYGHSIEREDHDEL